MRNIILASLLTFAMSSAALAYTEIGDWKDASRKHRTTAQWQSDYDACAAKFEKMRPASQIKAGPPQNYYGPAMKHVSDENRYIIHSCMPQSGWKWIVKGYLELKQTPYGVVEAHHWLTPKGVVTHAKIISPPP